MAWNNLIQQLDRADKTIYEYVLVYADPVWLRNICHFLVDNRHITPILVLFFVVYTYRAPKASLVLLAATLILLGISETTTSILKDLFERHRPVYQTGIYISTGGYSLPSAHATNTMAFAVFWASRFKPAAPYLYIFSLIIGFARVLSNFHFPGDVVAGWFVGFLVGTLFIFAMNKFEKR
jgi:undecaprenyl-diphosphatase